MAKQELHVEFLNKCISELQRQTEEQRLALQDAQYEFVESGQEQVRQKEGLSMKEKVLRNTEIRSTHEMGEINRAQELRVHEVSVQKLTENRETIQQPTSIAANARTNELILRMILEIFKMWNQIVVEDCLTFPANLR